MYMDDNLPERHEAAEFYAKYTAKDILGRGASSVVRLCVEKNTGREYAVKVIDIGGDTNPNSSAEDAKESYDSAVKEIQALRTLAGHPNIIGNFIDVVYTVHNYVA